VTRRWALASWQMTRAGLQAERSWSRRRGAGAGAEELEQAERSWSRRRGAGAGAEELEQAQRSWSRRRGLELLQHHYNQSASFFFVGCDPRYLPLFPPGRRAAAPAPLRLLQLLSACSSSSPPAPAPLLQLQLLSCSSWAGGWWWICAYRL
jgi:hypothetical protein